MEEGYSKHISDEFYLAFCNLLIASASEEEKKRARQIYVKLLTEYDRMKDKNKFVLFVSEEKKKLQKEIEYITKIQDNRELLLKEYNLRNEKLPKERQIFNISELIEILDREKKEKTETINILNEEAKPANYNSKKKELEEKLSILKPAFDETQDEYKYLVNLQKSFLKCVSKEIEAAEKKDDYISLVYTIRYYRNLFITQNSKIKDIPELNNNLNKIACKLITTMCKKSIFNIFCKDIAMNYKIILQALNSSIADIDDIDICLKLDENSKKLNIEIYDNDTIDSTIEVDYALDKKDLSKKQKKHVPLVNF